MLDIKKAILLQIAFHTHTRDIGFCDACLCQTGGKLKNSNHKVIIQGILDKHNYFSNTIA